MIPIIVTAPKTPASMTPRRFGVVGVACGSVPGGAHGGAGIGGG
ncbi:MULTISPECIES: hypothetical protein [Mycolicibacterium]|nr:hypothetical protein [Mycolicibacterium fortuitum]